MPFPTEASLRPLAEPGGAPAVSTETEDLERDFVLVALLIRPQGRHGELIADILTDFPERFSERKQVYLFPQTMSAVPRKVEIEHHWLHKGRVVFKFAGISSISEASSFSHWYVAVKREQRAPVEEGTVYVGDLIGCRLFDETTGADLGPVLDVARGSAGGTDILVLQQGREELLVPFAKAYLVDLDLEARMLRMRLPTGLTDINGPITDEERSSQRQT
jgi:16S rRNA processing protein RimM